MNEQEEGTGDEAAGTDGDDGGNMPWSNFNKLFKYLKEKDEFNFFAECNTCPDNLKLVSVHKSSSQNLKSHLKVSHIFHHEE